MLCVAFIDIDSALDKDITGLFFSDLPERRAGPLSSFETPLRCATLPTDPATLTN